MAEEPILVVGGGLTALAIAKTLKIVNASDRIRVLEGSQAGKHPGYSLTLLSSTIQELESAWNCPGAFASCGVDAALGKDGSIGKRYINASTGEETTGPGQAGDSKRISRDALDKYLKKDLTIEYGKRIDKIEKTANGHKLTVKDGSSVQGPLVLACDGVHSTIRSQLFPSLQSSAVSILPFVVYTGQRKMSAEEAAPFLSAASTVQTALASSACISFSFNTIGPEGGRLQWIYSRKRLADRADALYTPDRSNQSASEIPLELYDEIHALADKCKEPFKSLLKSIQPDKDRQYNWLMREVNPKAVLDAQGDVKESKVFFFGDAMHAMPIFGGLGGNQALLDGAAIGQLIASTPSNSVLLSKLADFQALSRPRWEEAAKSSRSYLETLHSALDVKGKM